MPNLLYNHIQQRNEGIIRYEYPRFIRAVYKQGTGCELDVERPKKFTEKLQWLQLYHHDPLMTQCADKIGVREYVERKLATRRYFTKVYGVWDNPGEIPFDKLPSSFVLKANHGSGMNIIVPDKSALNIQEAIQQLRAWLAVNYAYCYGELVYRDIRPRVFCEEFLEEGIRDYKFYCFNGEPKFLYVADGGNAESGDDLRMIFLDMDWKPAPFQREDYPRMPMPEKPDTFDEMVLLARKLAEPFYFVRSDFYCVGKRTVFSELTFFPGGGTPRLSRRNGNWKSGVCCTFRRKFRRKRSRGC